ncbi:MAG: methionyl-tRNA formyltransferase [Armatimonadota bacterium]|nr:methionyl-tRNA formyltransferase [Armatimonadota bacterium]
MRVVFMGTSAFAVPVLSELREYADVIAIVTQPDRPSGRGRHVSESPVKQAAKPFDSPILQPERVREQSFVDRMSELGPLDAIVVAAFGQIIPKSILDIPRLGCVNVHGSLLPKYRGAAPIQHAVMNGETRTGVTTMLMDPGLDTGPILLQEETGIGPDETAGDLEARLAEIGARLLIRTLEGLDRGDLKPTPQDDSQATLARSFKREDAAIDWNLPAERIVNTIRAFTPRPGAYALLDGAILKIWRARVAVAGEGSPGSILTTDANGITLAGGTGAVLITEVQPENRKRMSAAEFARGLHLKPNARFGA